MYRVKPSKSTSVLGVVVGAIFVFIGITQFAHVGVFGIVWTLVALAITVFHAINAFSSKGVSTYNVDVQKVQDSEPTTEDVEVELRKLHRLREDRIISEEEYIKKKDELLDRW